MLGSSEPDPVMKSSDFTINDFPAFDAPQITFKPSMKGNVFVCTLGPVNESLRRMNRFKPAMLTSFARRTECFAPVAYLFAYKHLEAALSSLAYLCPDPFGTMFELV